MKPLRTRMWQWLTWRVDCSWCSKNIRQRLFARIFAPTVSHGICPACVEREYKRLGITR